MTLNQALIAELKNEGASTRKLLERVPTDKNDWKPHDKSMNLGRLSAHVADLPGWVSFIMNADELDLGANKSQPYMAASATELAEHFEKKNNDAIAALEHAAAEEFDKPWTLRKGDHVIFTMPKAVVLRSMALSHLYHHRGQLSVYLRLLNVPIPGMYGPSADDIN